MIQTKNLLFLFFSLITFCANAQWQTQNIFRGIDFNYVSAVDKHHVYTIASKQDADFNYYTCLYMLDSVTNIWKSNISTSKDPIGSSVKSTP